MAGNWVFRDFEVRTDERRLLRGAEALPLGARAFDLLVALIAHRDRVVGKDELLSLVWPGLVVEENNLTVQISALRKVLGANAIATVPGRGYRLTLPVAADPEPNAAAAGPSAPERPSIAVLPFDVLADDPRLGYLADGLVEDVIALLARAPGFLVISRASSFEFRRRQGGIHSIAQQLGVRYVVEGSVRPVGTGLRVTTQLVEASSSRVLWSGQLESERDTAADLQQVIARGIFSELEPELTRAEISQVQRRHPDNVDAWSHYRQAVGAMALKGWTEAALQEARDQYQQALVIDPHFALARAQFALITALGLGTCLIAADAETAEAARIAAETALTQESGDSQVLGCAGCALSELGQTQRGAQVLRQALEIDPSNAQAHVALGAALALQGELESGIERMRHGMRISPRDRRLGFWAWALAGFLLRLGRADEALSEARRSALRDPGLYLARIVEAAALRSLSRLDEARDALAVARRIRPGLTLDEVERVQGLHFARQIAALWE